MPDTVRPDIAAIAATAFSHIKPADAAEAAAPCETVPPVTAWT